MKYNKKTVFYLKILIVLVLSFIAVGFLTQNIFLASTPKLRPDLGSYLLTRIKGLTNNTTSYLASLFKGSSHTPQTTTEEVPFQKIAQGVYAKEQNNITYKIYKSNEVEWKEYTFEYKGIKYTIRYAAGDSPPNADLMKNLLGK